MALQLGRQTRNIRQPNVDYIPTLDLSVLDVSPLNDVTEHLTELQTKDKDSIDKAYSELTSFQDDLTGLDFQMRRNNAILNDVKHRIGIDENTFKFSMSELRNPFKITDVKNRVNSVLQDVDVKQAILEEGEYKKLQRTVKELERSGDPFMASLAKSDILELARNDNGLTDEGKSVYEINKNDYKPYNLDSLAADFLKDVPKETIEEITEQLNSGFTVIDTYEKYRDNMDELAASFLTQYGDDTRFLNTVRSKYKGKDIKDIESRLPEVALDLLGKMAQDGRRRVKRDLQRTPGFVNRENIQFETNEKIRLEKAKQEEIRKTKSIATGGSGGATSFTPITMKQASDNFGLNSEDHGRIINELNERGIKLTSQIAGDILDGKLDETMDRDLTAIQIGQNKTNQTTITPATRGRSTQGFNYSSEGIDFSRISLNESNPVPEGEVSDRSKGNGVYSVGDGGTSYGSKQMHKDLWSEFAKQLNSTFNLGYNEDDLKGDSSSKETNLDFIEDIVTQIGESDFKKLEEQFLYERKYKPAINRAERLFGRELSNEVRTFIADSANQHGQVIPKVIEAAKSILDTNTQLDPSSDSDVLKALAQARTDYVNSKPGLVKTNEQAENIINNRINPLHEDLEQSLIESSKQSTTSGVSWFGDGEELIIDENKDNNNQLNINQSPNNRDFSDEKSIIKNISDLQDAKSKIDTSFLDKKALDEVSKLDKRIAEKNKDLQNVKKDNDKFLNQYKNDTVNGFAKIDKIGPGKKVELPNVKFRGRNQGLFLSKSVDDKYRLQYKTEFGFKEILRGTKTEIQKHLDDNVYLYDGGRF